MVEEGWKEEVLWVGCLPLVSKNQVPSHPQLSPLVTACPCRILFSQQSCKMRLLCPLYRWGDWGSKSRTHLKEEQPQTAKLPFPIVHVTPSSGSSVLFKRFSVFFHLQPESSLAARVWATWKLPDRRVRTKGWGFLCWNPRSWSLRLIPELQRNFY